MKLCLVTVASLVALTPVFLVSAQSLPCGNIVEPEDIVKINSPIKTTAIDDCLLPFGELSSGNPFSMTFEGDVVTDGAVLSVPSGGNGNYSFTDTASVNNEFKRGVRRVYKHVGNDYEYIETPLLTTEPEYTALARAFLGESIDVGPYVRTIINGTVYEEFTDYEDQDRYFNYEVYVEENKSINYPKLTAGDYTVVWPVYGFGFGQLEPSFWNRLWDVVLPTAFAGYFNTPTLFDVYVVTFTIAEAEPEPIGASSVLFLPGIQASRLYINPFILNEDQIWPPNSAFNNDIRDLSMNLSGVSDKNVYTRDIIDTSAGVGDVYKNFAQLMNRLNSENKIESWFPYAYDWRYSVKDIANNGTLYEDTTEDAIDKIQLLAEDSYTNKVTIIGHSNGGLLAKAIMKRLQTEGKANLIDKVIFLASPQLGTPKAIGTILHGYDQSDAYGGIVMDGQIVRKVLNNMPGAYGLLPSEKYFNGLTEPLVTFNENSSTLPYSNIYGSSISNYLDMVKFVKGEDGLDRGLENQISKPTRTNIGLLDTALAYHNDLDNWIAPIGVEVIEIVGTGLPTMKAVEYREISENKCASAGTAGPVCVVESEIKPYALLTHYGDGTVVQRSAEAYEGEKRKFFVNLDALEKSTLSGEYIHHNITEAPPVQDLISDLILSNTTINNEFISNTYTVFDNEYDVEMIDSPVRLLSADASGKQTGVVIVNGVRTIKEEIPGSQYFEFGDTKYFVVPKGTNRTTKLFGEANGGYTLTTVSFGQNDSQAINTILKNATATPNMVAEFNNTNGLYSNIVIDINGDGITDTTISMTGVPVALASYSELISKIKSLSLSKLRKQALLLLIHSAQVYANKTIQVTLNKKIERGLLHAVEELIKLYIKKGYITQQDGQNLLKMIVVLKN